MDRAKAKIAFIFFEEIHMLHHFIGIASELVKTNDYDISIVTYEGEHKYLYSLLKILGLSKNIVYQLPTTFYRRITEKITRRNIPSSKYLFEKNKKKLLSFDALVFSDINQEFLYDLRKDGSPKFIFTHHGAGNGSYPYTSIESTKFDLIFAIGQSAIDSHKKYFNYTNTKFEIIGYSKFDVAKIENKGFSVFKNDNPIILYNPHFKRELSSWYTHGKEILNFFLKNNNYNLIFAPHINLFNKKGFANKNEIDDVYYKSENIHVDLGSINSVNMTYTLAADLYIGDVSSQVLEYLIIKRPCIFVNRIDLNWATNINTPKFWKLGEVVANILDLDYLITNRSIWQEKYINTQTKEIEYLFDMDNNLSSSVRGANAIVKLLNA